MSALEGASKYLNNVLLARGLLPDGKPLDFANSPHGSDNRDATMSKIINLVHDLVLRRDRDMEQHENMASSIRNLRAVESQHTLDLQHVRDKNQQLKSETATACAHERTIRSTLKTLETQIKDLKEQNLKMKSMLDQVRAKCTSDVRKRDVEIEKLKGHLVGLQRGKRDAGGVKINTLNLRSASTGNNRRGRQDPSSSDWSLEKETNDFLAALVNETSTENVSLRHMVDNTLKILKEMTGVQENLSNTDDDGIGIPGQYRKSRQAESLVPVDALAEQMDLVLEHCRSILKDPSFVPIEEVQIREEEIAKLRAGWEKMANRWKEVVTMMGQWKQRMVSEGRDADVGEFSNLSFGRSIATRPDGQPILGHDDGVSSVFEESNIEEAEEAPEEDQQAVESDLELSSDPEPTFKRLASSPARRGVRLSRPPEPSGGIDYDMVNHDVQTRHSLQRFDSSIDSGIETAYSEENSIESTSFEKLAAVEAEVKKVQQTERQGITRKRKASIDATSRSKNGRGRVVSTRDQRT